MCKSRLVNYLAAKCAACPFDSSLMSVFLITWLLALLLELCLSAESILGKCIAFLSPDDHISATSEKSLIQLDTPIKMKA